MDGWAEEDAGIARKLALKAWRRLTPLALDEHRDALKSALRELQDALLRVERGTAARRTTQIAAKIGTTSAITSALFGAAALFGTASTGTAIGTLSGAAFTSAPRLRPSDRSVRTWRRKRGHRRQVVGLLLPRARLEAGEP